MPREAKFVLPKLSLLILCSLIASCTFNPFTTNNQTTGSPVGAAAGAGIGAGSVALLGGSKSMIAAAGIGGGAIGYYVTTLRFESGGIMQSGGQVYTVGDMVGIEVPSDQLFEANTAEFKPQAPFILDSVATVLQRKPNNNILISGNTSGFNRPRWEKRLSEERAKKVSAYLWNAGVSQYKDMSTDLRKLDYVGYGNYFPVANTYTNDGIRANSRVQITSYPSTCDLHLDPRHDASRNVGSTDDTVPTESVNMCNNENCMDGLG